MGCIGIQGWEDCLGTLYQGSLFYAWDLRVFLSVWVLGRTEDFLESPEHDKIVILENVFGSGIQWSDVKTDSLICLT